MGTLHCTLENEADLYVNERQKIRHSHARSAEDRRRRRRRRKKIAKSRFFTSQGAYVKLRYNYSDVIHSFNWKSALKHDVGV